MACSKPLPQPIQISSKPINKPILTLPEVDELNMKTLEWIVINENNLDQVIEDLSNDGQAFALYALTGDGYSNLGLNLSEIRKLVEQQKTIIAAYRNYYEKAEEALDGAVILEE